MSNKQHAHEKKPHVDDADTADDDSRNTQEHEESPHTTVTSEAEKMTELEQQAGEYLLGMKRLQAELENYRKRVERDQESFTKYASQRVIEQLLPVLENFDKAMATSKDAADEAGFRKAIEMIHTQFKDALAKEGLEEISGVGKPFDPALHEPLLQEASDQPANTVLDVLQPGFKLHDRVLRHARVKLSKGKE